MRTSPIYYISPRHISLTPNCNGSANDIAVDIQQGAKLKVYAPGVERLGMNPNTNTFREWTLEGRNRTLKGGDGPYTVYARLPKSDFYITPGNAYLVFAAQRQYGSDNEYGLAGQWFDRYSYVTDGGLASQYDERGFPKVVDDPNFWWVKLGTVSAVTNGMRTIDLDTGILGTEQWNAEWQQKPDELPLRIDLSTKVAGKELGSNPYVRWGQTLLLTASLVKGFDADAETTVERWTISRNTGNAASDEEWNSVTDPETEEQTAKTMSNGAISLSHLRVTDDFAGAVAAIFTVTAWGTAEAEETEEEETEEEEETLVPLAVATITINAETQERYEVVLSTGVMSRNPNDGHYSPDGIGVRVRCTDQRGITEYLTRQRFFNASLAVEYRQVGSESPAWTRLSLDASSTDAFAVVPTSAFANDNNVDVRLVRTTTSEPYTVLAEFDMKTVAFVRNGEDSGNREWIYYRSAGRVTFGTSNPPLLPSAIAEGQVAPAGAASGTDTDKSQAGWVPNGWFDNPPELNSEYKFIYESYRDSEGTGWGEFTRPRIYDSTDLDGGTPEFRYQWNQSPTSCPTYAANSQNPGEGWSVNVPNRPDGYYLWAISALHYSDHYGPWGNPIRMTGDSGTPGEDSKEREWIYIGKPEATTFSGNTLPANITTDNNGIQRTAAYIAETDDFVPLGWSDTAIAIDDSNNRFVYESWRVWDGAQGKWGAFQAPVLRSNWGRQGVDGDGVQYVFKLFANELTEQQCESSSFIPDVPASPNEQGEYIPSGTGKNADWSDDPLSPTPAMPFCYCSAIKRIGGTWGSFGRLGLWATYAESGLTADIDNELDAFGTDIDGLVITQQIRTTKLQLFYGITPQTITAITAAVYRADTNAQVSGNNIIEVSHSGLNTTQATIDVTVKAQATITYDVYVDITATCSIGSRTVRFTLKHVASGAPGVNPTLYQLLPSATSIAFKKNAAGNGYVQQQQTVTCGITESNGTTTTPHPDSTALGGYRVYYRKSSDTNFTQLTSAGVTVQATEQTSFVEFVLRAGNAASFSADTTSDIVDRETIPVLKDGLDGGTPEFRYQWNQSPSTCPTYAANAQNPGEGWSVNVPNRPDDGYYLWAISALHYSDHYGPWGNPIRMTGDSGTPGEDSKEREWIYIGKPEATTFSGNTLPGNITTDNNGIQRTAAYIAETDDFVPLGWSDTAIAIDDSNNRFVYESWRVWDGAQGAWGAFQAPVLRSNWGRQGVDGDGVQYVFKLFANELTEQQCESSSFIPDVPASPNEQGEYIPSGTGKNADWSDDPLSPTPAMPFCYCSAIKRIGGTWGSFGRLGLWATYAESGLTADIDNELDAFGTDIDGLVITQQIRTTKLQLFYGITPQTITAITAAVYRADTNAQVSGNNIIEVSHSGLNSTQATIDVTVKAQATITYDVYVDITATCSIGSRTVRFTLKHVASGAPGVNPTLYQLLPSATSIAFKKNAAGNGYTQQQQTITCGITESNGNTTTPHPDSTALGGYRVYCRKSSDTNFTQLTSAGVTVQASEQTSFVEFVLRAGNAASFSADTTADIVDRETIPVLKDGLDGGTQEFRYQWNQSPTTCPSYAANSQNPGEGWSVNVPNRPADGYYLWAISALHYADHYGPWGNPIRMTGDSGTPGEDSKEREWIYIGKSEATTFSGNTLPANITTDNNGIQRTAAYIAETDDFVPQGWSDTAIAIDDSNNRFVYESWRVWDGAQGAWGAFQAPVLRSNWGRQGVDGDGVQYVFKLFANELTEQQCESSSFIPDVPASPNEQGEYIPSGTGKNADWSDDPLSPTAAMPFCYCSAIKRIGGTWGSFGRLGLWSAYAESGLTADIDNELDAFGTDIDGLVITQQIRTTKLQLFYGITPQTITAITAAVFRADTNAQVSDSNIIEVSHSGLNTTQATIDVTVKAQATITYDVYVDITATCSIGSRTVRFTLKHVASGAPGVNPTLYQLLPSATSIAFKKNAAGNGYVQQQQTVTCGITESNGNTTTPHPDSTALGGYRVYYRKSSDTNFTQLTSAGVTVQAAEQTSFVEFVLRAGSAAFFSADTTSGIVDRETIPVLKDGLDGEQGPEGKAAAKAVFSPSVIFVDANADGNSIVEQVFLVSCYVEVEGNNAGYEQLTIGTTPSGITAVYNSSTRKVSVTVPGNVAALNYEGEVVVAMTASFGGREYEATGSIPIVAKRRGESVQGDDGDDGYGLTLTPSVLIFNEKLDINRSPYVDYSNNTVTAVVFKGSTPLTPVLSKLTTASSYSGCVLSEITVSGGTVTMGSGSIGSGVTEGFFTVNIKADGGNYDQDVRINFYVNRFGSWEVTVENGISTEVGRQITYGLQEGGVIKTAYSADIEKSAQGLTQQFTEQISRASADSRNLFGFCKGVVFDHAIPFIQGYGMIGRPWEGSDLTARVFNLGMYGRLGYYTVSCLVKMSASAGYVRLQMNWHQAVSGTRAVTDGVVGTVYATTTGWKRITATFLFDESSENHIGTSLNEGQAGSFAAGDINGYIDIGLITSGTDDTKIAANDNMIFVRHLKVEYKDSYSDFCEADEDIACLGQRSMVTAAPDDFTPEGPAGSRSYAAENTYGGITVEDVYSLAYNNGSSAYNDTWSQFLTYPIATRQLAAGKVYTLSFWARATQAGLALSSVLRLSATGTKPYSNNGSIVSPSVEKVYVGGNGFVTEGVSQNGMTEVRLTTAWKQYFVYYYAASSAYLYELVAATIYGGSNQGKSCTVYVGGVQLQEGYVMSESYFSSLIEQNARRISLVQQSGSKLTGIDMQNGTIDIFADKFRLKNTDGQQTLGVNKNGDLEVLGVIRAKNLYRMVAFAWGQGSSSNDYSIASIKNSDMDECYYVGSLDGLDADYKALFTPGEYVMLSEIKRRTDGYYSSAPSGFDICTGYADYIVIVDNGSNVTRHTTVCLPRAADLEGKVVEIVNRSNSGASDTVRVKQVGTYGYHFVMGFYASGIAEAAGEESFGLSRDERRTLVAASGRWVVV